MSPYRPGSSRFCSADDDLFSCFSLAGKKKTQRLLTTLGGCNCHDRDESTNKLQNGTSWDWWPGRGLGSADHTRTLTQSTFLLFGFFLSSCLVFSLLMTIMTNDLT
jgi:hypothetical protein